MNIKLVDVDSKIPNLALMKISTWHKLRGDAVGFDIEDPDKVYISCIFTKNAETARGMATLHPDAEISIGGSGISNTNYLSEEKELIIPDYDLYPSTYSQGYTTRGCIRKCPFCVVPEKEGKIREVQHPSEFHNPRFNTCMIMDNNLFAASDYWQRGVFSWFEENKIKMLSPQGWDIRLLNPERAALLKSVKHAGKIHFAWDDPKTESSVIKGVKLLEDAGFKLSRHEITFYVLVGYNTAFEEDLYRCRKLKELGIQAYVMRYRKEKRLNALARWTNTPLGWFWAADFYQTDDGKKLAPSVGRGSRTSGGVGSESLSEMNPE